MNYEIKSASEASVREIFFDKNTNKLSFKNNNGIITILNPDPTTEVVNISSAQILALGTTPIELLPAAGANKYYDIEKIILEYTHVTTAYTSPDLVVKSNSSLWGFIYSQLVLLAGSESSVTFVQKPMDYNSTDFITAPYNSLLNTDLTIGTYDDSNPTLGDGTLRAIITYTLRTFGAQ